MSENAGLGGSIDRINLAFVEREATSRPLMKLSIQLHLTGLSLSNTVLILDRFGVERSRSTVHNWVHNANVQPSDGRNPDHVAVDETVIRLDEQQYWLSAAVDADSNELLHVKLSSVRNQARLNCLSPNSPKNTMSAMPCFSWMVRRGFMLRFIATVSDSSMKHTGNATPSDVYFVRENDELLVFE